MTESIVYRLTRSGLPSFAIDGTQVAECRSPNADVPDRSHRQWFEIDVYRSTGGALAAHIKYKAGQQLGREVPKCVVEVAGTVESMRRRLSEINPLTYVTGWPAEREDRIAQHNSVCKHATEQWGLVLADVLGILDKMSDPLELL